MGAGSDCIEGTWGEVSVAGMISRCHKGVIILYDYKIFFNICQRVKPTEVYSAS